MRLIDADKVIECMKNTYNNEKDVINSIWLLNTLIDKVDEIPTAYNDIVKQLEYNRQAGYNHGYTVGYNEAVADFVNMFKSKTTMENNLIEEISERLKVGIRNE